VGRKKVMGTWYGDPNPPNTLNPGGGFPTTGVDDIPVSGLRAVNIGSGFVAFIDDQGKVWGIERTPTQTAAPSGPPASYYSGQIANQARQLDQYDRDLNFRIQSTAAELAEKKRQFAITIGMEKQRLAAEIDMLNKRLRNDMAIAQLDAKTRLQVANIEAAVSRRGQDVEARRIAVNELGSDVIRQSLFITGIPEEAGRTPLEITRPGFNQQFGISNVIPGAAGGADLKLGESPMAIRVGEAGEEIIIADKGRLEVIPISANMAEGGTIMTGVNMIPQREEAFRTIRLALDRALQGGRAPAFGGLTLPLKVPGIETTVAPPENIARRLLGMRPTDPRRQLILSYLSAAGIPVEEALARARAATPVASYSGLSRVA